MPTGGMRSFRSRSKESRPAGSGWRRRRFNDGSCVRPRPERVRHEWSYDFVSARTHDKRTVRMLNLIDEHSRECLMIRCERSWSSSRVIAALADVMVMKRVPEHLRSDNGPESVARDLRKWLAATGAKHRTSNRAHHGRTATAKASTRN
jgi:putative transposase